MATLSEFIDDTTLDVVYEDLADVKLNDKGKPTESFMKNWTQERRTAKFFEFCRAYDQREDSLLKHNYQQFSHRLHWHECPFVDLLALEYDPEFVLHSCILFSFTNEHWLTYRSFYDGYNPGLRDYINEGNRPCRSDLFQIYYPKGTKVEEWLLAVPQRAAKNLKGVFANRNRPYTMMEFAKLLNEYFVKEEGFTNAMYPSKNAARHVAMSHPEWVDPESFLHGGTGFFDGLQQVMNCPHFMSKAQYEVDENGDYVPTNKAGHEFVSHMKYLVEHPDNPIKKQKYLNVEDKLCMSYKFLAIKIGIKGQTKQIPYEWIYPKNWSLKTGKYHDA